MTQLHHSSNTTIHGAPLVKRMLIGAGIALTVILIFLILGGWFTQEPRPEWQKFWMFRPLVVVPIAGAMGGALYYFLDLLRCQGGWKTAVANILSVLGYLVILWLGTVFGLAGIWWH